MNAMYSNIPKKNFFESNIELHELINIGMGGIIFFSYIQKGVINNYLIDNYHFM